MCSPVISIQTAIFSLSLPTVWLHLINSTKQLNSIFCVGDGLDTLSNSELSCRLGSKPSGLVSVNLSKAKLVVCLADIMHVPVNILFFIFIKL